MNRFLVFPARLVLTACVAAVITAPPLAGQDESSVFDDIWGLADFYENDSNPVVQRIHLSGRFQYDYAYVEDDGNSYDEWNVRRARLGIQSTLFHKLTAHVEADFNPQERDPFYVRLTDAYLEWSESPEVTVTVGKQSVPFTMDGQTSSRSLLTIDRSNLTNNIWFPQEYMPGVSLEGEASSWIYQVGVYSSGEATREFGRFNAGFFTHALVGRDVGASLGTDRALVRATYVYQDPDPGNTFTRQLEHVGSLTMDLADGHWGTRADVSVAAGYLGQSDLWGAMLMPFFDATEKLQFVTRYTHVASSDPNGVRLARYESQLTSGRGDTYDEIYLGVNYYFYGHLLKLQSGIQLAKMQDEANDGGAYSGLGATVGFRMSW